MVQFIHIIEQIDDLLMRLLTFSFFYPDLEDRPQTSLTVLATLVAVEVTLVAMLWPDTWLLILALPFWLNAIYEWRLWYRLRR